jgi:cell division protein FtsZ
VEGERKEEQIYVQSIQQKNQEEGEKENRGERDDKVASGLTQDDEDLLAFIEESKPKIYVVGTGGSGNNTLNRLFEMGVEGATLIAMNTDARHLLKIKAHKKYLMGRKTTRGQGAGSNPELGEAAAKESASEIGQILKDADMVFVTCGLGGGTGTGSAPIIAEEAKKNGALVVSVVTLPFKSEGRVRYENAIHGLEKLKQQSDTVIIIKNDKLLTIAPELPLNHAFKICDEVLAGAVKGIVELVTITGLVSVDFADLKTILAKGGYAMIGVGESNLEGEAEDRALVAIETALNSPLLDADLSSARRALINVVGGEDMTLREAQKIVEETAKRIHQNAHIIWGARVDNETKKSSIRVMIVLTGVKFKEETEEEDDQPLELDIIG